MGRTRRYPIQRCRNGGKISSRDASSSGFAEGDGRLGGADCRGESTLRKAAPLAESVDCRSLFHPLNSWKVHGRYERDEVSLTRPVIETLAQDLSQCQHAPGQFGVSSGLGVDNPKVIQVANYGDAIVEGDAICRAFALRKDASNSDG